MNIGAMNRSFRFEIGIEVRASRSARRELTLSCRTQVESDSASVASNKYQPNLKHPTGAGRQPTDSHGRSGAEMTAATCIAACGATRPNVSPGAHSKQSFQAQPRRHEEPTPPQDTPPLDKLSESLPWSAAVPLQSATQAQGSASVTPPARARASHVIRPPHAARKNGVLGEDNSGPSVCITVVVKPVVGSALRGASFLAV